MVRLRDPNDDWAVLSDGDWTDYLGDSVHRSYTVTPGSGTATDGVSRLAGVGYDDGGEDGPMYYASDQIGSARRISDSQGCGTGVPPVCSPELVARRIYSAFGEPVDTANSGSFNELHYGYAGAYGYEEADANALDPLAQLGWLHVGERYYAPELGRFVQRDPIGIRGGVNVYEYVRSGPATDVDPSGLDRWVYGSGAHATLVISNPCGGYITVDFAATSWVASGSCWGIIYDRGVISIAQSKTLPSGTPELHVKSTAKEDDILIKIVKAEQANPPGYNVLFYSCWDYAWNRAFTAIPPPVMPPSPYRPDNIH